MKLQNYRFLKILEEIREWTGQNGLVTTKSNSKNKFNNFSKSWNKTS